MKTTSLLQNITALAPLAFALAASAKETTPAKPTFTEHIAPLLYQNCVECHRAGTEAPFALISYPDAKKRARTMIEVTQKHVMPPWLPDREGNPAFAGERHLSDAQIELLARWVATGMEEGPKDKLPKAPVFPVGWLLGKPDLIVTMPVVYETPATGRDEYRDFVIPISVPEDKWVKAVDFKSTSRTVHHATYFLDDTGAARAKEGKDGRPGFDHFANGGMGRGSGQLGGWVIGRTPRALPLEQAYRLAKGSDLVLSLHVHPSGKVEREQATLAIYFADGPPKNVMMGGAVPPQFSAFSGLDIPAGAKDFTIRDSWTVPVDVLMWEARLHMHYLGKSAKGWAVLPDGKVQPLLTVTKFNFDLQDHFEYEKPILLPKGTVIHAELVWDNSADNPANQHNPPQRVSFGLGSDEEMGQFGGRFIPVNRRDAPIFMQATRKYLEDTKTAYFAKRRGGDPFAATTKSGASQTSATSDIWERLKKADRNSDGKISRDEAPAQLKENFDRIDSNRDGFLDKGEVEAMSKRRSNL